MNLLVETSCNLQECNSLQVNCSVCKRNYSGQNLAVDGNFFITLPILQQLSWLLSDKPITNELVNRLQSTDQVRAGTDTNEVRHYRWFPVQGAETEIKKA